MLNCFERNINEFIYRHSTREQIPHKRIQKKREIRTAAYPTLQAFELAHSVKISDFEAHADMNAQQSPCQETTRHILALPTSGKGNGNRSAVFDSKGMHHCERHIPRASTVARFPLSLSKCSKFGVRKVNVQVNAFSKFTYADFCVFPSQPPPSSPIPRLRLRIGLVSPAQKKCVLRNVVCKNHGQS